MNETSMIVTGVLAYALGYGLGYFAMNIGMLTRKWGALVIFVFPIIFIVLFGGAEVIYKMHNFWLSLVFALGFVMKLLGR